MASFCWGTKLLLGCYDNVLHSSSRTTIPNHGGSVECISRMENGSRWGWGFTDFVQGQGRRTRLCGKKIITSSGFLQVPFYFIAETMAKIFHSWKRDWWACARPRCSFKEASWKRVLLANHWNGSWKCEWENWRYGFLAWVMETTIGFYFRCPAPGNTNISQGAT